MMKFITPIILVGLSVAIFFVFISPTYSDLSTLRGEVASYNQALDNSKALENERDKLTAKYNTISADNLMKLQKLLPENVDNIRLILEIGQVAAPYGMTLRDVKYNVVDTTNTATSGAVNQTGGTPTAANTSKDYGVWNLEFSITGTYDNFLNFTKDLESNLRIVDISSISFTATSIGKVSSIGAAPTVEAYKYNFKIKTYWLKN